MKKIFTLMLLLALTVTLVSCTKDKEESKYEGMKVYAKEYAEEMEGQEVKVTYYVMLKDDSFGYLCMQDVIPVKYDDKNILDYNNDTCYPYVIDGDTLTLTRTDLDIEEEYTLTDEILSDDMISWLEEVDAREANLVTE